MLRPFGSMLRPSQRFLARSTCSVRSGLQRFCSIIPLHNYIANSRNLPRRGFFNFPSLPTLPFASIPRVVSFSDMRVVPYPGTVVLQVVCDVGRYKEFLPWVEDSRVISTQPRGTAAVVRAVRDIQLAETAQSKRCGVMTDGSSQLCELCVGFGPFTERYTSRVTVAHLPGGATSVKATASDSSVFSLLVNEWIIQPSSGPCSSVVKFSVSFKFKSPAYAAVAETLFTDLSLRMASAFEQRFAVLHKAGRPSAQ